MVKYVFGILAVFLFVGGGVFWIRNYYSERSLVTPLSSVPQSDKGVQISASASISAFPRSIFIPYWAVSNRKIDVKDYDRMIYFGVSANEKGIDTRDQGFAKLKQFIDVASGPDSKKFLALRMTDSEINSKILEDKRAQSVIIHEVLGIAAQYGFNGIILDFELSSLGFESVETKITSFFKDFYEAAHGDKLLFGMTLFGDTFYRARPYDVAALSKNTDEILVMAYDFHKSRGNPGPNFPYEGKKTYGYDFKSMVDDFLRFVPSNKLNIVFGMFGYDWELDSKNQSVGMAKSLSYSEINKTFLQNCSFDNCVVNRDYESSEMKITYTDNRDVKKIIWFEDSYSVERKKEYLTKKGITAISLWAYSYF